MRQSEVDDRYLDHMTTYPVNASPEIKTTIHQIQ
jgi:hypothetical protein